MHLHMLYYARAVWVASVARIVNPHLPIEETDSYGTVCMQKNIEAKWEYALNVVFPNQMDRYDAIAPDLGLNQKVLQQLILHDYREWNVQSTGLPESALNGCANSTAIPEKGVRSLTLILCTVQQVLGIEYCPLLPDVGERYCLHNALTVC